MLVMLVDTAVIQVQSGKGGDGHVSFRREKYVPKGGPDGGDGGDGGSVILRASRGVDTLLDFSGRRHWKADDGGPGRGKQQHGANADDLIIPVPPGTLVYNADSGEQLADLEAVDAEFLAAEGGRGGFGNEHFKSATHQTPREFTPGGSAQTRNLRLELKLIADVGLVGLPNAGKSTLLASVSRATPKIADYPFTTLEPNLGIAELSGYRRFVLADIPGLIEGASHGAGLGAQFLKHIERTRVLVHLLDPDPSDGSDPIDNYHVIRRELAGYSRMLADKPQIIALSKMDLIGDDEDREAAVELIRQKIDRRLYPLSSATGEGLSPLLEACWTLARDPAPDRSGVADAT